MFLYILSVRNLHKRELFGKIIVNNVLTLQEVFAQRVKVFKMWKETEANLTKKREMRAKLELQRRMDKIPAVSAEITDVSFILN